MIILGTRENKEYLENMKVIVTIWNIYCTKSIEQVGGVGFTPRNTCFINSTGKVSKNNKSLIKLRGLD